MTFTLLHIHHISALLLHCLLTSSFTLTGTRRQDLNRTTSTLIGSLFSVCVRTGWSLYLLVSPPTALPRVQSSARWGEETAASSGPPGSCGGASPPGPGAAVCTPTRTGHLWPAQSPRGFSPSPFCQCWTRYASDTLRTESVAALHGVTTGGRTTPHHLQNRPTSSRQCVIETSAVVVCGYGDRWRAGEGPHLTGRWPCPP